MVFGAIKVLLAILAFCSVTLTILMAHYVAAAGAAILLAAALVGHRTRRPALVLSAATVLFAVTGVLSVSSDKTRVDQTVQALRARGADGLTTRDKSAIYLTNIFMAAGGAIVGFPEVALETFMLMFPGADVRTWRSDFAMKSEKMRRRAAAFAMQARGRDSGSFSGVIRWSMTM